MVFCTGFEFYNGIIRKGVIESTHYFMLWLHSSFKSSFEIHFQLLRWIVLKLTRGKFDIFICRFSTRKCFIGYKSIFRIDEFISITHLKLWFWMFGKWNEAKPILFTMRLFNFIYNTLYIIHNMYIFMHDFTLNSHAFEIWIDGT